MLWFCPQSAADKHCCPISLANEHPRFSFAFDVDVPTQTFNETFLHYCRHGTNRVRPGSVVVQPARLGSYYSVPFSFRNIRLAGKLNVFVRTAFRVSGKKPDGQHLYCNQRPKVVAFVREICPILSGREYETRESTRLWIVSAAGFVSANNTCTILVPYLYHAYQFFWRYSTSSQEGGSCACMPAASYHLSLPPSNGDLPPCIGGVRTSFRHTLYLFVIFFVESLVYRKQKKTTVPTRFRLPCRGWGFQGYRPV